MDVSKAFEGITFRELVMWERPQATGIVVGSIATVLFLLGFMEYTLLTLACRVVQVLTAVWFVASQLGKAPQITHSDISTGVQKAITALEAPVVKGLGVVIDVISWQDRTFTGKVLLGSLVVGFFGSLFSDLTLIFLVTLGTFAGPITYTQNKEVIDANIAKVMPMVNDVLAKIPALNMQQSKQKTA